MKQWWNEKQDPDAKTNRIAAQAHAQTVSKNVNIAAMLSWHDMNINMIPKQSNIENNIPELEYWKNQDK